MEKAFFEFLKDRLARKLKTAARCTERTVFHEDERETTSLKITKFSTAAGMQRKFDYFSNKSTWSGGQAPVSEAIARSQIRLRARDDLARISRIMNAAANPKPDTLQDRRPLSPVEGELGPTATHAK